MAVVQLATSADVEAALGRDLTSDEEARVGAILDKASELFRSPRYSGQQFTPGTSTVRLKVNGGRTYLPQHPVTAVESVVDDAGAPVQFTLQGSWVVTRLTSSDFVTVTYSHGGVVPDLVRLTVADVARKVLTVDRNAAAGVSQRSETTGPFTESSTYAAWAVGGQTLLAPDDAETARSFRVRVPRVWVQGA